MIDGEDAGGDFSLVEHPLSARALAAPLHRHTREDEYSFVLEGRMGGLLGDEVVEAGPGDEPCRILEIIAPAGFEHFFEELVDMGGLLNATPEKLAELNDRYALEMKPESVPDLLERFGLVIGEPMETVLQLT
jgi:hypothetical protein